MSDKHPNSRWRKPNPRNAPGDSEVLSKFKEQPGWHRGARVRKR